MGDRSLGFPLSVELRRELLALLGVGISPGASGVCNWRCRSRNPAGLSRTAGTAEPTPVPLVQEAALRIRTDHASPSPARKRPAILRLFGRTIVTRRVRRQDQRAFRVRGGRLPTEGQRQDFRTCDRYHYPDRITLR